MKAQDTAAAFTEEAANRGFAYAQYRLANPVFALWAPITAMAGDVGTPRRPRCRRTAGHLARSLAHARGGATTTHTRRRSPNRAWKSRRMVRRAVQSRRISGEDLSIEGARGPHRLRATRDGHRDPRTS